MEMIMDVSKDLAAKAEAVARFRNRMKAYLKNNGECYDKFTITDRDAYLGYVTEIAVTNYLLQNYGTIIEVKRWSDNYDIQRIQRAVKQQINNPDEVNYVKEYFYDKYDLEIKERATNKTFSADVKTAETSKQPQSTWNFLYPVIQNSRGGKDCVILCYYYKSSSGDKIILVGYITEREISRKNILKAGEITVFGTINQIDNYETKVNEYKRLSNMLNNYFNLGLT